jgi:hypothetical protein
MPARAYLNDVAQRLVAVAPGARYPYRVRAVDSSDINAFTFPGGFLYVNRGLLAATRNESELAGVLAHEVSHVALRHGTHEASKAYGAQAGLGILGGLLGHGKSGTTQQIIQAIGGLGLNAVFMKFSRNDEQEADLLGIRMMKKAATTRGDGQLLRFLKQQEARDPVRSRVLQQPPGSRRSATRAGAEPPRARCATAPAPRCTMVGRRPSRAVGALEIARAPAGPLGARSRCDRRPPRGCSLRATQRLLPVGIPQLARLSREAAATGDARRRASSHDGAAEHAA